MPRGKAKETVETTGPADYRSKNFLLHTDLPPEDAKELLTRLETMLSLISRYWGRPNKQIIECFVVKDLDKWPAGVLDPQGIESIRGKAGITISLIATLGNQFEAKSRVYAIADHGTPQHEAVQAYCHQTFGTAGPVWYAEGMAEMGQYWKDNDKAVNCHPVVVEYLRNAPPKSLNEIVNAEEFTGDSWQNYAWRWALCHLLATNDNYRSRFQPLGLALLTKQRTSFEEVYGPLAKEITFEYLFFLKHFDIGYRVDLCSWDWKAKYREPRGLGALSCTIEAAAGWQPSRLEVEEGKEYDFAASGTWKIAKDGDPIDADGTDDGAGKLVGIIFDDYELSEPFELGAYGKFTAPRSGNLLLRCQDQWNELGDNGGKLSVKFKHAGAGNPLPDPREK